MSPSTLKDWMQLAALIPAILVAYKCPAGVRWMKSRITNAIASAMAAQIAPTLQRLEEQLQEVRHQVYPNGGGSMNDKLGQVLASSQRTERQVITLQGTMRAHQDADLVQARFESDVSGRFTWVSHAFLRWCNRGIEQVVGHGWINCISQADRERVRDEWEAAIAECREFALRFRMCDIGGAEFEVDAFAKPIRFGTPSTAEQWVGVVTRVYNPG